MRKLRDVLRLHYQAVLSHRAIAQACAIGLGTVTTYPHRATAAGVTWPVPADLDDVALEARLFARPAPVPGRDRSLPDWSQLHQELKKPGVTLVLLWQEYRAAHPTGYAYSQFCERYRQWARQLKPSMRQVHRAGVACSSLCRTILAQHGDRRPSGNRGRHVSCEARRGTLLAAANRRSKSPRRCRQRVVLPDQRKLDAATEDHD